MRGFFLDISTRTGWSLFESPISIPIFGTKKLPKAAPENYAGRTLPLREWMRMMITKYRPDAVAFESPFIPMGNFIKKDGPAPFTTTQHTLRLQIALATEVETTAAEFKISEIHEISTMTVKKALAGKSKLDDKSKDMMDAAKARGWMVTDDNQADALGVGIAFYDRMRTPVSFRLTA